MPNKTLDEQLAEARMLKEQRIREAEDKELINKADTIVYVLGRKTRFGGLTSFCCVTGNKYIYNKDGLKIKRDPYHLRVYTSARLVFDVRIEWYTEIKGKFLYRYIPGEFESKLEEIYQQAKTIEEQRELAETTPNFTLKLKELKNITTNFGYGS